MTVRMTVETAVPPMTATGSGATLPARTHQACSRRTMAPRHEARAPDDAATLAGLPDVAREAYLLLREQHGAMSAYALIEALSARLVTRRIYPQTVYRALATLVERNLVHRLESANSYRACSTPGTPHDGIHFLCTRCGGVEEAIVDAIDDLLNHHARQHRFAIDNRMIEVSGVCGRCSA